MPRFLVGITHLVYRRRAFVIAGVITALFLLLLAVLPALFASDPKLSNIVPAYSEVSKEVVDGLIHSSSIPLLVAAIAFSIGSVRPGLTFNPIVFFAFAKQSPPCRN